MNEGIPVGLPTSDHQHISGQTPYPWPGGTSAAAAATGDESTTTNTTSDLPWLPGSAESQLVDSLSSLRQGWDAMAHQLTGGASASASASASGNGTGNGKASNSVQQANSTYDEDEDYEEDQDMSPDDTSLQAQQSLGQLKDGNNNSNSIDSNSNNTNSGGGAEIKKKSTRGSRACQVCRKLKMRCVGAEDPPCKRCRNQGHEVSSSSVWPTSKLPPIPSQTEQSRATEGCL